MVRFPSQGMRTKNPRSSRTRSAASTHSLRPRGGYRGTGLEPLESRALLAVTLTYDQCDGTLLLDTGGEFIFDFRIKSTEGQLLTEQVALLGGEVAGGNLHTNTSQLLGWSYSGDGLGFSGTIPLGSIVAGEIPCDKLSLSLEYTVAGKPPQPGEIICIECSTSSVHGVKYHDLNGNGTREANEPGLNGWTIAAIDAKGNVIDKQITHARDLNGDGKIDPLTEAGHYWLTGLPAGVYTVLEDVQPGWVPTQPNGGRVEVTLDGKQTIRGLNFGNTQPGSIHGVKFLDANRDGVRQDNERLLPGWQIVLTGTDGRGNRVFKTATTMEDDPATKVNEAGMFWLENVPPGQYKVQERLRDGWIQTAPTLKFFDVRIQSGREVTGLEFGNVPQEGSPGSIHGIKWHDLNANGERERNEPGLNGVRIVLLNPTGGVVSSQETHSMDLNEDGQIDPLSETGLFWFERVAPGTYSVAEAAAKEWQTSFPATGRYDVNLQPNQHLEGLSFGNWRTGSIHGTKFLDRNGNGKRDAEEPGIPGWTIVVVGRDAMGQNVRREVQTMEDDPDTRVNEAGMYWVEGLKPGRYAVEEVQRQGWEQTAPEFRDYRVVLTSGAVVEGRDFGNRPIDDRLGSIHGVKYEDLNGNGRRDQGEPGIPGVVIVATGVLPNQGGTVSYKVQTMEDNPVTDFDESGMYWFEGIRRGVYTIEEVVPSGWIPSQPRDGKYERVDLLQTENRDGLDFGNVKPGSVHGTKYLDRNKNGKQEDNEPGLPGWTIVLTGTDGLGRPVERKVETMEDNPRTDFNEAGHYWIDDVWPGRYELKEIQRPGWQQTEPSAGVYPIVLGSGQRLEEVDFGNTIVDTAGSIHGQKREDINGNGRVDPYEPGLNGWTVVLTNVETGEIRRQVTHSKDLNEDGRIDPNTERGLFWFEDLAPGRYEVKEIQQPGWVISYPSNGSQVVRIGPDESTDVVILNYRPGSIHGTKFLDANQNGKRDANEPGLPGWTIVVTGMDGAGQPVQTSVVTMQDNPETDFDEAGMYWVDGLRPGRYRVEEVQRPGWRQTAPAAGGYDVRLLSGRTIDGRDFGNVRVTTASIHGMKYEDLNANGRRDPGEPGLPGWTVVAVGGPVGAPTREYRVETMRDNPDTPENEAGHYWLEELVPGRYSVREVLQPGWQQSQPANGEYVVTVAAGDRKVDVDFGNWRPGSVSGIKWYDTNRNGRRDSTEPGLPWFTIYADQNNNKQWDAGEPRTVTLRDDPGTAQNEAGFYRLEGLRPGDYVIREAAGDPAFQTYPGPGTGHPITVKSGQAIADLDFGNLVIAGDINHDGRVDINDFIILRRNFGRSFDPAATWEQGDLNGDGKVDINDFIILRAQFGKTAPTGPAGGGSALSAAAPLAALPVQDLAFAELFANEPLSKRAIGGR